MPLDRRQMLSAAVGSSILLPPLLRPSPLCAAAEIDEAECRLLGKHDLPAGKHAVQGLAVGKKHCFAATNASGAGLIHRFTHQWKWLDSVSIKVVGVDHLGAISHHGDSIWGGWLTSKGERKSMVTELRASDLKLIRQFDISKDVTWIDPVCFDGKHVWVGDLSDLGIHRYRIEGERLVRDAIFRYPKQMHFSQGLVIRHGHLYSIHTFGEMDGLFEFELASLQADNENIPKRKWLIAESTMHLEGFDFVPGTSNQLWHAQGRQVDRWQLNDLGKQN